MRRLIGTVARGVWRASCIGIPKGDRYSRYAMYKMMKEQLRNEDLGDSILSISHSNHLALMFNAKAEAIREANYPEHPINKLPFPDDTFSAVVSDQVFEHIECTPPEAVAEIKRVLRPNGIAIHTTCFMVAYHGSKDFNDVRDGDYWRYTPSGLARLHKDYSRVVTADGWGNNLQTFVNALGLTGERVPEASWHPFNWLATTNRPSHASMVWVAARK
jgi:SAM-dependent methyltransferase